MAVSYSKAGNRAFFNYNRRQKILLTKDEVEMLLQLVIVALQKFLEG